MKIGIDAKWYFNGHPSGKVVVENIVNHIVKVDKSHEYYIFLNKKDKKLVFPYKQKNIHLQSNFSLSSRKVVRRCLEVQGYHVLFLLQHVSQRILNI